MATTSLLLIPLTLCFLVVLAAEEQGKATAATLLVINGEALCKSNTSRIISSVQLVINNASVHGGTGRTTSDGHILIAMNLNSTEQMAALMSSSSSKAYVTAPPHACGVPSLPAETVAAAEVEPIAMVTISDHDDADSVQRPTIAATENLLVPAVNASLHATANKGDVVHVVVAAIAKFACVALRITIGPTIIGL